MVGNPDSEEEEDAARGQDRRDLRRGSSIGGAGARAFAREGAKVEEMTDEIRSAGGIALTAQLEALDEQATVKVPRALIERLTDAVCYAA